MDEIDEFEIQPRFGTQFGVFYPGSFGGSGYLEGGYTLPEASDMAWREHGAYIVKITIERYDP
jgi:hypothetical protein